MSWFQTENVECPECGASVEFNIVLSVNAVMRPELREAILDNTFQRETCQECDHQFALEPEMSYLDVDRKQWILGRPGRMIAEWEITEQFATAFYEKTFGHEAPPISQRLGRGISPRVAFGWAAVREKLLCAEHDLEDYDLELLKLAIVRGLPSSPIAPDTQLRLLEVEDNELVLAWLQEESDTPIEVLPAPRDFYDEIVEDDAWEELRMELCAGPFVDMRRALVLPERAQKAP